MGLNLNRKQWLTLVLTKALLLSGAGALLAQANGDPPPPAPGGPSQADFDALRADVETLKTENTNRRDAITAEETARQQETVALKQRADDAEKWLLPVGFIIGAPKPINTADLMGRWMLCNGDPITDTASPFHGQALPDMEDRFLKGVTSATSIGTVAGSNAIADDGQHTHTFSGGTSGSNRGGGDGSAAGFENEGDHKYNHSHTYSGTTSGVSAIHNHGVDKRPAHVCAFFYMRIK